MHWGVAQTGVVLSRMVKENLPASPEKAKPQQTADKQSEQARTCFEEQDAEGGVSPVELSDIPLELSAWSRESEIPAEHKRRQHLIEIEGDALPTHLRLFSSQEHYGLVKQTYQQLQHSGYYWEALTMEEAHALLSDMPLGTFLIRDSIQPDVLFTLSYRDDNGPTSVRVLLSEDLRFSLHGSNKTFPSLFALLTHYTGPSCKLTVPHRKERPERLTHMCRRALVRTYGAGSTRTMPGLSEQNREFICSYPHSI